MSRSITIKGVAGLPEIRPGDRLAVTLLEHLPCPLEEGDVLVIASKIVAKAQGRVFCKKDITPGAEALRLSELVQREPSYVELVLRESACVVKAARGVMICRTHEGFVLANAGIDASNAGEGYDYIALPTAPDRSAEALRTEIKGLCGCDIGIIISDTFGRAWRRGQTDVAIGCAGIGAFVDYTGTKDRSGRLLSHSLLACADEIAGAAELVMGKRDGIPAALVRGLTLSGTTGRAASIPYPLQEDLFLE